MEGIGVEGICLLGDGYGQSMSTGSSTVRYCGLNVIALHTAPVIHLGDYNACCALAPTGCMALRRNRSILLTLI